MTHFMGGPQASKIPGAICAQAATGNILIRWSGGILEAANEVTGPWDSNCWRRQALPGADTAGGAEVLSIAVNRST